MTEIRTRVRERAVDHGDRPPAGGPPRYFTLAEPAPGVILAGTCGQGVVRSTDGGRSWSVIVDPFGGADVNTIRTEPGQPIRAATDGGLVSSEDGGETWDEASFGDLVLYDVSYRSDGWLLATAQGIIRVGPDGRQEAVTDGPDSEVYRLLPRGDGWVAATESSGVWLGEDDSWSCIGLADVPVYALARTGAGDLLAGTRGSGILVWGGAAGDWQPVESPPPDPVVHTIIHGRDGSLLAGTGRGVARSGPSGADWVPLGDELAHHRIFSLLAASDGSILAASYDGVWRWAGDGSDWAPLDTGLDTGSAFALHRDGTGTVYAGGRVGAFRSDDAGRTWTPVRPPELTGNVYAFCRSQGRLLVGTDDGLWDAGDGEPGDAWGRAGLDGLRVFSLTELSAGHVLAGTLGQGLWTSAGSDGWERAEGVSEPLVFDLHLSPSSGRVFAATGFLDDGRKSGGIVRSADGVSWQHCDLDANTVYDVVETSSGTLLGGAQRCRVLRSVDGGDSFVTTRPEGREESKMYGLAVGSDDAVYLAAGAELLRSDDEGESWDVVGGGLDGVTVYGLIDVDGAALLVATSSGVYRSVDRGDTWVPSGWTT